MTLSVEGDADLKRDLFKVCIFLLRAKHAESSCLRSNYSLAMELWEVCLLQLRGFSKKYRTISEKVTPSAIVTKSSQEEWLSLFRI